MEFRVQRIEAALNLNADIGPPDASKPTTHGRPLKPSTSLWDLGRPRVRLGTSARQLDDRSHFSE